MGNAGGDDKEKLVQLELQVYRELCKVRINPPSCVPSLRSRMENFVGMKYVPPELGGKIQLVTMEGRIGVEDAIDFLGRQSPLPAFMLDGEESESFQCGTQDKLARVYFKDDHAARRKAALEKSRTERWMACCWFGPAISPASKIVEDLIIDDGDFARKHRLAVFNSAHVTVRIQIRKNRKGRLLCKLHFSTALIHTRRCRDCGRCYSCDFSCLACWTHHHSLNGSSNCSSRPQTTSPRQRLTSPQQPSISLPTSPTEKVSRISSASTCSDLGGDTPSRRAVCDSLLESPGQRHTFSSPASLDESSMLERSASAPFFSPPLSHEVCGGSHSSPISPSSSENKHSSQSATVRARARVSSAPSVKAKLAHARLLKPWYHQLQVQCSGRLNKADAFSRSLPHLQMIRN